MAYMSEFLKRVKYYFPLSLRGFCTKSVSFLVSEDIFPFNPDDRLFTIP